LLYKDLRILPGNEHMLIDVEFISHKFLHPGDVLERDAAFALSYGLLVLLPARFFHLFSVSHKIHGSGKAGHMLQQKPGIQIIFRNPCMLKLFFSPVQCFPECHTASSFLPDSSRTGKFSARYAFQSKTASTEAIATSIILSSG